MQETVELAEETEPLLAQKLYDSYRRTQQEQAVERLKVTEQLLERNLSTPGTGFRRTISKMTLSKLSAEIDDAAEAVLGSEIDAIRRAYEQLDSLSNRAR